MRNLLQSFSLLPVCGSALLCLSGTAFAATPAKQELSYFEQLERRIVSKFTSKEIEAEEPIIRRSLSAYIPAHGAAPAFSRKPTGCFVKARITGSLEKEYLVSGCPGYDVLTLDVNRNERIFCTEEHAVQAGWKKSSSCPQ